MGHVKKIIGGSWSHRIVLIVAICIYLGTLMINPEVAKSSAEISLKEIQKLAIPIVMAMFLGGLVKNLITRESVSKLFGTSEPREVLTAGAVGSILPPCPFTAYPVIKGFKDTGMRFPALMTMLVTSTVVEGPQIFAGIVILGTAIEGARILFAFLASLIVAYIFLIYTRRRRLSTSRG
ncbi:MAG: permease [Candidatus Hodarchaeaceae archaeon]|nr:permease [Candidatus Hodarchaeaceae archaeon]